MNITIDLKVLSIVLVLALLAMTVYFSYQLYFPKTGYFASSQSSSTNSLNVFEGKITNKKVSPGRIEGFSTYDANCLGTQQQTECDAGIRTNEYGELNFHYFHNMEIQPCLHMFGSERVIVDILNEDGDARITRTIDLSSMGGHHG